MKQVSIDDEADEYTDELTELIRQAQEGEIERDEFVERVMQITTGLLLLSFLMGSRSSLTDLANDVQMQMQIAENEEQARRSARRLADDIYVRDQFTPDEDSETTQVEKIRNRAELWTTTAVGMYALGQMFRPGDPYLEWQWTPGKDHCSDCQRLNGQVHRASEWRASGWQPQSQVLACNGYRCGCRFVDAEGPSRGNF